MFSIPIVGRKIQRPRTVTSATPQPDRADLRIRNLLDDPGLRRVMGLDTDTADIVTRMDPTAHRPERRFDRRRLLEDAAA